MDRRYPQQSDEMQEEAGHPCSRQPPELCDGARVVTQEDGSSKRVPMPTPRTFCEPCRSRIITCLGELPSAYQRLADALGDAPETGGGGVRSPFGPSIPIRAEIDALMRVIAAILPGWEARVRGNPRLQLTPRDPERNLNTPESVKDAAETIAKNIDVLLSLEGARMSRTFTFPFAGGAVARIPIPAELEALLGKEEISDEEILRNGDGWVTVAPWRDGASAGNEIITLHYRARRQLRETKPAPDSFDGVPCRSCEVMALERAEPPSDPSLAANHSKCPGCGDEMDRETFAQWADTYAQWAAGAGIRACKRCRLAEPKHEECSWAHCACGQGEHPRRRAVA